METKRFCNLTSGLEWYEIKKFDGMLRIESTALEQKRYDFVANALTPDFLMAIAMGREVAIYDTSSKKSQSRAIYQGIPFIRYLLHRLWRGEKLTDCRVRGHNCAQYLEKVCQDLPTSSVRLVLYFKKFDLGRDIVITGHCDKSDRDGDYAFYKELMQKIV